MEIKLQQQINPNNIDNLMQQVLDLAKQAGATACELNVGVETGFTATARMAKAETLEYYRSNDISITVYLDQKSGSVTTSDCRIESLQTAVNSAVRIAKYAESDPAAGLADEKLLATSIPKLAINFPWEITPQQAMELAQEGDQVGLDYDPKITNSDGCSVSKFQLINGYANSNGFVNHYLNTQNSLSSVLIAKQSEQMQRDYDYYTACDANDLPTIKSIATSAAEKTLARLNPEQISTQKMPVLFTAKTARGLLGHFVSAIKGRSLYKKASFLLDCLNQPIFPDWFYLQEQPHLAKALGSVPYDTDGILTYDKYFIEAGVLKHYMMGTYSARKLNMQSTANADSMHNLIVTPGKNNFDAMLKELDTGLMVTEVLGQGVNLVTGDYSRGAAGFWVENGKIQFPVDEVTIAGNLKQMFMNVRCVGNDVDRCGRIQTPCLIVDSMMIAGSQ